MNSLRRNGDFWLGESFKVLEEFQHNFCSSIDSNSGEGNGTPLQYSCLENPMDGGAWQAAVHGVAKSRTRLSNFTFTFYFPALEKEIATHSNVLAWRIPGAGEPGGLPSMGLHRVGHDWSDAAAAAADSNSNIKCLKNIEKQGQTQVEGKCGRGRVWMMDVSMTAKKK